jgi:UDP-N-acetylmuramate dehydrogenase
LAEKVGAKGLSQGKAQFSSKHANFIINNGGALAGDILCLIEEIEKRVKKNFGIKLEREIEILGER